MLLAVEVEAVLPLSLFTPPEAPFMPSNEDSRSADDDNDGDRGDGGDNDSGDRGDGLDESDGPTTRRLSEEQRRLVEDHWHVAKKEAARIAKLKGATKADRGRIYQDALSTAGLALTEAALTWQPNGEASFWTWAVNRIRYSLLADARRQPNATGAGYRAYERLLNCQELRAQLSHRLGRRATDEEMGEYYGWSRQETMQRCVSDPKSEDDTERLIESIPAPEEPAGYAEVAEDFIDRTACLGARGRQVVWRRYVEGESAEAIGEALGLSCRQVREILADCLRRLREHARQNP